MHHRQGAWAWSIWLVAVAVTSWQPFVFEPMNQPFNWTLGSPLEGREPFVALEEMATKLVLFGLGGALVASVAPPVRLAAAYARIRCGDRSLDGGRDRATVLAPPLTLHHGRAPRRVGLRPRLDCKSSD